MLLIQFRSVAKWRPSTEQTWLLTQQLINAGVDVSIEVSANYAGLNEAIRTTGYAGRIVSAAYYVGHSTLLSLEG